MPTRTRRPRTTPWTLASRKSRRVLSQKGHFVVNFPEQFEHWRQIQEKIPKMSVSEKLAEVKKLEPYAKVALLKALDGADHVTKKKPGWAKTRALVKRDFGAYLKAVEDKAPDTLDSLLAESITLAYKKHIPEVDAQIDQKLKTYLGERKIPLKPEYDAALSQAFNELIANVPKEIINPGPLPLDFRRAERRYIETAKMIRGEKIQQATQQHQLANQLISLAFKNAIRLTIPQRKAIQNWVKGNFEKEWAAKRLAVFRAHHMTRTDRNNNILVYEQLVPDDPTELHSQLDEVRSDFFKSAVKQLGFLSRLRSLSVHASTPAAAKPKNGVSRDERLKKYQPQQKESKGIVTTTSRSPPAQKPNPKNKTLLEQWRDDPRRKAAVPALEDGIKRRLFSMHNLERIKGHGEVGVRILSELLADSTFTQQFGDAGIRAVVQALSQFPNSKGLPIESFQNSIASAQRTRIYRHLLSKGFLDPSHGGGRFVKLVFPKNGD